MKENIPFTFVYTKNEMDPCHQACSDYIRIDGIFEVNSVVVCFDLLLLPSCLLCSSVLFILSNDNIFHWRFQG